MLSLLPLFTAHAMNFSLDDYPLAIQQELALGRTYELYALGTMTTALSIAYIEKPWCEPVAETWINRQNAAKGTTIGLLLTSTYCFGKGIYHTVSGWKAAIQYYKDHRS